MCLPASTSNELVQLVLKSAFMRRARCQRLWLQTFGSSKILRVNKRVEDKGQRISLQHHRHRVWRLERTQQTTTLSPCRRCPQIPFQALHKIGLPQSLRRLPLQVLQPSYTNWSSRSNSRYSKATLIATTHTHTLSNSLPCNYYY